MGAAPAKKQPRPIDFDEEDDDAIYQTRPPSSARRYIQPVEHDTLDDANIQKGVFIQRRRSSANSNTNTGMASQAIAPKTNAPRASAPPAKAGWSHRSSVSRFPILAIVVGMLLMALLAFVLSSLGAWWQMHQDDVTYGRPRTFQMDAVGRVEDCHGDVVGVAILAQLGVVRHRSGEGAEGVDDEVVAGDFAAHAVGAA